MISLGNREWDHGPREEGFVFSDKKDCKTQVKSITACIRTKAPLPKSVIFAT